MVEELLRCPRDKVKLTFQPSGMYCSVCKENFPINNGQLRIYDLFIDDNPREIGRDPKKVWDKPAFERTYERTGYHEASTGFDAKEGYPAEFSDFVFKRVKGRLLEWVKPGPDHKILDIGCGAGYFLFMTLERYRKQGFNPTVVGIDISDNQLSYMVQRMAKEGVDAVAVHASGEYLPFPDNSFDLITCSEVIEHVRNPDRALQDMYRILKPGGLLLISTPSITAEEWWARILKPFSFVYKKVTGYKRQEGPEEGYEVPWRAKEFRGALQGANFDIIDFEYNALIPHLWYSRYIPKPLVKPLIYSFVFADRCFKPVLKPLTQHFVVRAKKGLSAAASAGN